MKKLLLYALFLGAIAGVLENLRNPVWSYIPLDDSNIYLEMLPWFIFSSLFGICICITRGVTEKSTQAIKTGVLLGILAGIISVPIEFSLYAIWPIHFLIEIGLDWMYPVYLLIFMMFVGLFAGSIAGILEDSRKRIFYGSVGGLVGGAISVLGGITAIMLSVLITTTSEFFFSMSPSIDFMFNVFIPPVSGALRSVIVWFFIALADRYYLSQ